MSNIFVSYSHQSEAFVRILVDDIEALGHTVWFDRELSGGQAWWDQILETIRECDVFAFALDTGTMNSTACKRECEYAANLGKLILPVLITEGVSTKLLPPILSKIQYVDYRKRDRDAAFRLARAFTNLPPPNPLPDPLPVPPDVPISYLVNLTEQIERTSALSYEKQSSLVVDLKRSLRDPETTDDARTLLERLRKRRDLLATIAEEIDEVLRSMEKASSAFSQSSESVLSQPELFLEGSHIQQQPTKTKFPESEKRTNQKVEEVLKKTTTKAEKKPSEAQIKMPLSPSLRISVIIQTVAIFVTTVAIWVDVNTIIISIPCIVLVGFWVGWLSKKESFTIGIAMGISPLALLLLFIATSKGPSQDQLPFSIFATVYTFLFTIFLIINYRRRSTRQFNNHGTHTS